MKILFRTIVIFGALFIIGTTALALFFQTDYGKEKLTKYITDHYGEGELSITFDKVGGALPFQWVISDAYIRISKTQSFYFEKVTIRPYFWRLLRKQIAFHEISAAGGSYIDEDPTPSLKSISPDLPLTIYVKKFSVDKMSVRIANRPTYQFDAKGSFRITKGGKRTRLSLNIKNAAHKESSFQISFRGIKNENATLQIGSGIQLKELYPGEKIEGVGSATILLNGSWEGFNDLLTDRSEKIPIQGSLTSELYYLKTDQWYLSYPLNISSNFTFYSDLSAKIPLMRIQSAIADIDLSGYFSKGLAFEEAQFIGQLQPTTITYWDGPLHIRGNVAKEKEFFQYRATIDSPMGKVWRWPFEHFSVDLSGKYAEKLFTGSVESYLDIYAREWKGSFLYTMDISEKALYLDAMHFYSPFSEVNGSMQWNSAKLWGALDLYVGDLSQMQPFFPDIKAFGTMRGDISLYPDGNTQSLAAEFQFFDTIFAGLHTQNSILTAQITELFSSPKYDLVLQATEAKYRGLQLDSLSLSTQTKEENWPFSIALKGEATNPIDLLCEGAWKQKNNSLIWDVQTFDGYLFDQPFSLKEPLQIEWAEDSFEITPFTFEMPESKLTGRCLLSPSESNCTLVSDLFPLSFFSLNPWNLTVEGAASIDFSLTQKRNSPARMKLECEIFETNIYDQADLHPIYGNGKISANYQNKSFALDSTITLREDEKITVNLLLPIDAQIYPFSMEYPRYGNLLGSLSFHARVEDILDYINIGPHRLEGELDSDIKIGGTWRKPIFDGQAIFKNGKYDNYYTGTSLGNLYATFELKEREIAMKKLSGDDGIGGTLQGKGEMTLSLSKHFPFQGSGSFKNLELVNIDLVKAKADGETEISGNSKGALAKGTIIVTRADFAIPDKISFPIPSLPVTYINQGGTSQSSYSPYAKKTYPLSLDFTVSSPSDVYISGRGLTSQWKGDFSIGGTYDNVLAKGSLELVKGDFLFAGKTFDLTSGVLTFTGEGNEPPFLQISGQVEQSGIAIITQLRGKLTEPRLTFRSIPPLPVSAILSYLIFGQDISEISPLQAAQLAATAASLSGEGPDILELARKSLGLDRLAVVSTPTKEGVEGTAIQVGKYLAKGLLFSISQGPNPSLGNISVEVDLTHGFIFEAESMQQQEQGKFSLKWHKNY